MKYISKILIANVFFLTNGACQEKSDFVLEETVTAENFMSYREAVEYRCSENVQNNLISPSSYKLISIRVLMDETIEITDKVRTELLAEPKYNPDNEQLFFDQKTTQAVRADRLKKYNNPTSYRQISYTVEYDASNRYGAILRGNAFCILEDFGGRYEKNDTNAKYPEELFEQVRLLQE